MDIKQQKYKRVLLVQPFPNVYNNPTTRELINHLNEEGYEIHLWCRNVDILRFIEETDLVIKSDFIIWWIFKSLIINYLCSQLITNFISWIDSHRFRGSNYNLIISVDRQGLIEASGLNKYLNLKHHNINYEIFFKDETRNFYKKIEIKSYKDVGKVLIQDDLRAKLFSIENNFPLSNIFTVPLSESSTQIKKNVKTRLRDKLGIPLDKKVLISIGSMHEWTMISEIIEIISSLDKKWVLILNSRFGDMPKKFQDIIARNNISNRVFINQDPVADISEMQSILDGVSYGLAFYKPIYTNKYLGKNIENIGLASGKISTYCKNNIPVITNANGIISELLLEYNAGFFIKDITQLPSKIDSTTINPDGPRELFMNKFDFLKFKDAINKNFQL
jgi:hypothetical protein